MFFYNGFIPVIFFQNDFGLANFPQKWAKCVSTPSILKIALSIERVKWGLDYY